MVYPNSPQAKLAQEQEASHQGELGVYNGSGTELDIFTNAIWSLHPYAVGFPSSSVVKNPPAMQETQEMQVRSLGWEDPLEEGMAIHSSSLA